MKRSSDDLGFGEVKLLNHFLFSKKKNSYEEPAAKRSRTGAFSLNDFEVREADEDGMEVHDVLEDPFGEVDGECVFFSFWRNSVFSVSEYEGTNEDPVKNILEHSDYSRSLLEHQSSSSRYFSFFFPLYRNFSTFPYLFFLQNR